MKVSCVIPNYNGGDKVVKAAKLALKYSTEVIVIDDCSTDQSILKLNKIKDKKIKILQNKVNRGSSYSRNLGAKKSKEEYILFLDSDCYLDKKNFQKFKKRKGDILYPKIIDSIGKIYNYETNQKYLFNSVCFLMNKRDFDKVGGFDENIPIYMDDVDFFYRCYKMGLKTTYIPKSIGYHDSNKSNDAIAKSFFNNVKNTVYFCLKHRRKFQKDGFPSWFTVFLNIRRSLINRDRFYGEKITNSRFKTFFYGLKEISKGFKMFLNKTI